VNQCKECGAILPDNARFCLQCGKPVDHSQEAQGPKNQAPLPPLDFVQPALAGGMFLGLLSTLPILSAGNAVCCMWVLLGGAIAVTLLAKQRPGGITYGDGAFVGVLSGLFGAIVGTIVHIPVQIITSRLFVSQQERFEEWFRQYGVEGPLRDWMLRVLSGEISAATILFTFFANLLMWSLFAMVGGILTVAIMNKRAQRTNAG
jgi:zinc-ribbon domain